MKNIRNIFLFVVFASLNNCSVRTDLFVQNLTSENIIFKIIYNTPIEIPEYENYILQYKDGIVNPKLFLKNENLKFLKINQSDQYLLTIEIPTNSTARIEATFNSRYLNRINEIEFNDKKYSIREFMELAVGKYTDRVFKINEE